MPDNAIYYHAAYIAAAVVYGGYIISLAVRIRRTNARRRRTGGDGGLQGGA